MSIHEVIIQHGPEECSWVEADLAAPLLLTVSTVLAVLAPVHVSGIIGLHACTHT